MKRALEFFKDDTGQFSNMRMQSFLALIIACILSFTESEFDIILIWIVAAFAPKAIQKFAERKK